MQFTDITERVPFPFRPRAPRGDGVHLTDITHLMREEYLGAIYPSLDDLEDDEQMQVRLTMEQGFIFEDALSIAFGSAFAPRYNDVLYDGVLMNPDGVVLHQLESQRRIDEYKFTSSYKSPRDRIDWLWQVKAYCQAFGALRARFYVLHINGIARGDRGPTYKCYECEFSRLELAENWHAIKQFGVARGLLADEATNPQTTTEDTTQ